MVSPQERGDILDRSQMSLPKWRIFFDFNGCSGGVRLPASGDLGNSCRIEYKVFVLDRFSGAARQNPSAGRRNSSLLNVFPSNTKRFIDYINVAAASISPCSWIRHKNTNLKRQYIIKRN